jgi:RNase adapter protein RapZ
VKSKADFILDTSNMMTRQLKEELTNIFVPGEKIDSLIINVISFGFKYGIPIDADLVFDVRFLPNPYYIPELKKLSGNEDRIKHYVLSWKEASIFLEKINDLLSFLTPNYIKEGKSQLVIAIGCTGGRHRSVTIANEIHKNLKKKYQSAILSHRDIDRDPAKAAAEDKV